MAKQSANHPWRRGYTPRYSIAGTNCFGKQRKLTAEDVHEIRARYSAGGVLQKDLAKEYGVHPSMISHVVSGRYLR